MKKQVLRLDLDDSASDFDGYAFMLFHTLEPGYAFVDDLNRLYGYALTRIEDLQLHETLWPLYTYDNTLERMRLFLVEKPAAERMMPRWGAGQKLLIARGDDARECLERVYNDFLSSPATPQPGNLAAQRRFDILSQFQQNFTTVTLLDPDAPPPQAPKAVRERNETRQLLLAILDYLDIHRLG